MVFRWRIQRETMENDRRLRFRFRTALFTVVLSVLLFTVAVVGGGAEWSARYAVGELSNRVLDQTSLRIDQHILKVLDVARHQSELNQRLIERGRIDPRDPESVTSYFLEAMYSHPELSFLSLGLESGHYKEVARDRRGELTIRVLEPLPDGGSLITDFAPQPDGTRKKLFTKKFIGGISRNPTTRPYYTAAKVASEPVWTETYIFIGKEGYFDIPGVTRATPLYVGNPDGTLLGVLTADFDLYALSQFLQTLRVGRRGYAFVLEVRSGAEKLRVIAHPEPAKLTRPTGDGSTAQDAMPAHQIDDPVVQAFLGYLPAEPESVPATKLTRLELDIDSTRWLGGYRRLGGDDSPNWIICMVIPESDVMGSIMRMRAVTIVIGLLALGFAVFIVALLARAFGHAVRELAAETEQIGQLRLDSRPYHDSRLLEVYRLWSALDEMKAGLRSFQKFVPAELVRALFASGREAELGSERAELTIYFSDITNFTTISEKLEPEALAEFLGEYLGELSEQILAADGTIDKYIGDTIMAFWGAPNPHPDHAVTACRVALANQARLAELRRGWQARGLPEICARIGLNTGEVIVGNFGSKTRLNYTVIGDAANLAARLEGLNKVYGTEILLSAETYLVAREQVVTRPIDRVLVKGKERGDMVYELLGMAGEVDDAVLERCELYGIALDDYFNQRWQAAIVGFDRVLLHSPDDEPARVMRERAVTYQNMPPAADWDGVFRATSK